MCLATQSNVTAELVEFNHHFSIRPRTLRKSLSRVAAHLLASVIVAGAARAWHPQLETGAKSA
jgi:hypothetical protein